MAASENSAVRSLFVINIVRRKGSRYPLEWPTIGMFHHPIRRLSPVTSKNSASPRNAHPEKITASHHNTRNTGASRLYGFTVLWRKKPKWTKLRECNARNTIGCQNNRTILLWRQVSGHQCISCSPTVKPRLFMDMLHGYASWICISKGGIVLPISCQKNLVTRFKGLFVCLAKRLFVTVSIALSYSRVGYMPSMQPCQHGW